MVKGKFIVIDGTDGSGKGTQTKLIIERLKEEGKEALYVDFPQYDRFFGKMVGEYLDGRYGDIKKIHPKLASIIYACDRLTLSKEIKEALKEGKAVIANRFTSSSMAHQGCKLSKQEQEEFLNWVDELEFSQLDIPRPDKVIILKVPCDISQKLVTKKDARDYTEKVLDGHEGDIRHLSDAGKLYVDLAEQNENWKVIDCVRDGKLLPIQDVNDMIMDEVIKTLE